MVFISPVRTPGGAVGSWILVPAFLNARSSTRFVPTVTPFFLGMWYLPSWMTPPALGPFEPSTGMNWIEPSSIGRPSNRTVPETSAVGGPESAQPRKQSSPKADEPRYIVRMADFFR